MGRWVSLQKAAGGTEAFRAGAAPLATQILNGIENWPHVSAMSAAWFCSHTVVT